MKQSSLYESSHVTFIVYLFFCFYFNFELLINIHTVKLYKMNRTFLLNNYKTHRF